MKDIIKKALTKAKAKNLSVPDTAELIIDYLDIAGILNREEDPEGVHEWLSPSSIDAPNSDQPPPLPEKPLVEPSIPKLNKVISSQKDGNTEEWDGASLSRVIEQHDLTFTVKPDGWKSEIPFKGTIAIEPRNMHGVGVIFKRSDEPSSQEFPIFFPYTQPKIDVPGAINELKVSISQILRVVKDKIEPKIVPITGFPAIPSAQSADGTPTGGFV